MQKNCVVTSNQSEKRNEKMSTEQKKRVAGKHAQEVDKIEVSGAVIRRLPRYFRYLRELLRQDKMRVSSAELSRMMGVTASQIRQDLNCFGGFGQQGYGYNVPYLYSKICELLGVDSDVRAIVIGAGDLGRALVRSPMFEKRGIQVLAMFDIAPEQIGREIAGVKVRSMNELAAYCKKHQVDMAVLTLPKESVEEVAEQLSGYGVQAFWNFTSKEIKLGDGNAIIENVHLGDSLMVLNYRLARRRAEEKEPN